MERATSLASEIPVRKKPFRKRWDSPLAGYLFISPWLIGFLALTAYPMLLSLYYSFTNYTLMKPIEWVGLDNYERIITADDKFAQSLKLTFYYVLASVPLKLIAALMVALLLKKAVRGISVYRTAIYFPSLIGASIAVSLLWKNIFGVDGFFNQVLGFFGIPGTGWVTNPDTALWSLIGLSVWQFGSSMVIFLAGLKQIPNDLYEASAVDGAGKLKQFFKITLPMLSPTLFFNLIMGVINSFQMFTPAYVITGGGPMNSTYVYALYLYERAFSRYQLGYSSSLAWIMLILIVAAAVIINLTSKYWVFYESESQGGKGK
ncbi:sugar ABC transporter permease [Paenibacillus sp. FSL H8-0457]|uniref:carbohydrate ABC transporter permease n=1 Tax=Bacillales TaxID=1385 RepID=UPI000178966C|nr:MULTISPECIES: sugar ABC transporter permease [Paenibacillus]ACX63329.1 binding-protein-dependent transport systems inner membrane component [Paenibacillus sp. Y412MC10]ETT65667.1 binding-protein-dependent transport systems inner membrane component [Paenibacillus sp. FSL H8-457]PCL91913.1 sugar ABC transporter permease [Paenibacillus lautus]QOT08474.1 sugar ABC transporter permease [Paenibacillus sp. JNUCC-32]